MEMRCDGFRWLAVATLVTVAFRVVPAWVARQSWPLMPEGIRVVGYGNFYYLNGLLFALILVIRDPKRFGLRIGQLKANLGGTLLVCGLALLAVATVYFRLPDQPFSGSAVGSWLISPLAQDLVFAGFLYSYLESRFPGDIHPLLPVRRALVMSSCLFAAWHIGNYLTLPAWFVTFQIGYTLAGALLVGLTRQWTGSVLYVTIAHSLANYMAALG